MDYVTFSLTMAMDNNMYVYTVQVPIQKKTSINSAETLKSRHLEKLCCGGFSIYIVLTTP